MKVHIGPPGDRMRQHLANALLTYLVARRNPTRARTARDDLAFSSRDFSVALRTLERRGLASRLALPSRATGHVFVEATPEALERWHPGTAFPKEA